MPIDLAAAALGLGLFGAGSAAVCARSPVAMCIWLVAMGALATPLLVLLGGDRGAVALALLSVGWAPAVLLAAILLTARDSSAPQRRRRPWHVLVAGATIVAALGWGMSSAFFAVGAVAVQDRATPAAWLAVLAFIAATGCWNLLAFGERGFMSDAAERGV